MVERYASPQFSLTRQFVSIGFALSLLATSPFAVSAGTVAQTDTGTPATPLTQLFGTTHRDLVARQAADDLPDSPVEEDYDLRFSEAAMRSTSRPDIHGETSVENFQGTQNNLSSTHESAGGFRQFLEQWYPTNFHRQDSAVSTWLFHDYNTGSGNYDLWTSNGIDYGIDAVRTAFHSSHGGMSNNVFSTSLGANWNSTGWSAGSNLMALGGNSSSFGDERLRYMFWDTCNSVMISGGNDPYTTWGTRAKGIRFVFGYETTSIDSPNYGKYFWEEWAKGKTFKHAFLDASWRISTGQAPALVAFGATQSEATSRRDNERLLSAGSVSNSWGAWSWYNARSATRRSPTDTLAQAAVVEAVEVRSRSNTDNEVLAMARAFGIQMPDATPILSRPANVKVVRTQTMTLAVEQNGNVELFLHTPEDDSDAAMAMTDAMAIRQAQRHARQLRFLHGQHLRVGTIRNLHDNVGTENYQGTARVTEKTVVLDQTIQGMPFIDPEAGHLEITFNARGQVTRVRNTLQALQPVRSSRATAAPVMTLDEARLAALAAFRQATGHSVQLYAAADTLPESEAIGYQMIDGKAVLVYRAQITSAAVPGMRPFQVIVPLVK